MIVGSLESTSFLCLDLTWLQDCSYLRNPISTTL